MSKKAKVAGSSVKTGKWPPELEAEVRRLWGKGKYWVETVDRERILIHEPPQGWKPGDPMPPKVLPD